MLDSRKIIISFLLGLLGVTALLTLYAVIVVALSGWAFAEQQFAATWYFVVSLAFGFGIQVGLYSYLRQNISHMHGSGKIVAASGTSSTASMLACCAHYLVNIAPLLGVAGIISLVAQYQLQLFWVGILFNLAGIIYIATQLYQFKNYESRTAEGTISI